jgi:hypothetical protein
MQFIWQLKSLKQAFIHHNLLRCSGSLVNKGSQGIKKSSGKIHLIFAKKSGTICHFSARQVRANF